MARKICTSCKIRPVGSGKSGGWEDMEFSANNGLCYPCGDEGQMWIAHHNYHESITEEECWYCHPEMNECNKKYVRRTRQGHQSPRRPTINHRVQCGHAQLPAARKACRAQWWAWLANQSTEFIESFNKR